MPYSSLADLRAARNTALTNSDYIVSDGYPIASEENLQIWKDYRQELRDLPAIADATKDADGDLQIKNTAYVAGSSDDVTKDEYIGKLELPIVPHIAKPLTPVELPSE